MLDSAKAVGVEEIKADMRRLAEHAQDLRPVWEGFKPVWEARQKAAFSSTSGDMKPLRASTLKRKSGPNKAIPLVRTGALRLATYRTSPVKETPLSASWGIPKGLGIRKLAILHKSMRRYSARIAVPTDISSEEQKEYRRLLREHLLKAWDDQ